MAAADENALLLRSLGGDGRAFGELICVHQRALFNVALRMLGNAEDARDVTQAAFVKAYRNLATFDHRYRFF
jgi:RNA polymerase sigma-70 factor (ECF subfamily)